MAAHGPGPRTGISQDIKCPTCGAVIAWDGHSGAMTCPYCQRHFAPAPAPAAHVPPMMQGFGIPQRRTSSPVVFIVIAAVGLGALGVGVAVALFTRAPAPRAQTAATTAGDDSVTTKAKTKKGKNVASSESSFATEVLVFGEEGDSAGQLSDPRTVAADGDGNIYVADYSTGRVQKFDSHGKFVLLMQVPKSSVGGNTNVFGMACDFAGHLYVTGSGDIFQFATNDGKLVKTIKGDYPETWYRYVAVTASNDVYSTTDPPPTSGHTNDAVKLDPNGKVVARYEHMSRGPIAVDGSGNMYVARVYPMQVDVYDSAGKFMNHFGKQGSKPSDLGQPNGIAVDGKGHVLIADGEVKMFDVSGGFVDSMRCPHGSLRSLAVGTNRDLYVVTNRSKVVHYRLEAPKP